jgi:glycine/D-amino acid oxidase-like deaminating enzyme
MSCYEPSCCSTSSPESAQIQRSSGSDCRVSSCYSSAEERAVHLHNIRASDLPVAIIGAGPVGLAAAAHLLARGLDCIILEAGSAAGAAPRAWGHVRMFSPWRYNIDAASRRLLDDEGWRAPDPRELPTGAELVADYLEPLARTQPIVARLRLNAQVTAVTRAGLGKVHSAGREIAPFEIRLNQKGSETRLFARAVIDVSGTWSHPAPAGASGLPALGEQAIAHLIRYGMPDVLGAERQRYAGQRTLVVGTGHSAIGTVIDLCALAAVAPDTEVLWASRTGDLTRTYGGGAADQLPERGALGQHLKGLVATGAVTVLAPFAVDALSRIADGQIEIIGRDEQVDRPIRVDQLVVATGLRPDLSILRELRLDLDPALECPSALGPLIDPNIHSCGTVPPHGAFELAQPEEGLFIAGMKSYGRAPTFLLATGYEQVRSIAAYLAGDIEAAKRVELDLPQTGVCSSNLTLPVETRCAADADRCRAPTTCCSTGLTKEAEPAESGG